MNISILDIKNIKGRGWVLGKGCLMEYLRGLKEDFFEFSVQRKIVNNAYLDIIYESVMADEPLPPITLTYQKEIPATKNDSYSIDEDQIEILDGLQRTYRLWVILYIYDVIKQTSDWSLKGIADAMKQTTKGEVIMQNSFINPKFIRSMVSVEDDGRLYIEHLIECYEHYDVYFNIWTQLDDREVIRRMLILNAGQKSVTSTHQFELLFLHFFDDNKLHYNPHVKLVRERDRDFRNVQRGIRNKGEYLMSSVVVALQSFINGRQLRIATANKINLDDNKLLNEVRLDRYFNADTLSEFINCMYDFDDLLCHKGYEYTSWYGKDTVLSGIYGAMGSFLIDQNMDVDVSSIRELMLKIDRHSSDPFNLIEYYDAYNNKLASTKVNVGNAVRKAIFHYTKDLLTMGKSDWYRLFSTSGNDDEE